MKRGWILLLMFSIGLNGGLLYVRLAGRGSERTPASLQPASSEDRERRPTTRGEPSRDPVDFARDHLKRMTETLRLDEGQQQAIDDVLREFVPQILSIEDEVYKVRVRLAARYAEPKTNEEDIRSLVGELNRTQARLDSLVAETILREVKLLTPDQRRLYVEIVPWGRPRQPQPPPPRDRSDRQPPPQGNPSDRQPPPPRDPSDRQPPPPRDPSDGQPPPPPNPG